MHYELLVEIIMDLSYLPGNGIKIAHVSENALVLFSLYNTISLILKSTSNTVWTSTLPGGMRYLRSWQ